VVWDDGFKYYEMIFVYVNNLLILSHKPKVLINAIGSITR
jgi:hypothetical protein